MQARRAGLFITRNFPPLRGGMERHNFHLLQALGEHWQVSLCGPDGASAEAVGAAEVREAPLRPVVRFLLRTMQHSIRSCLARRPSFVLAGSGLSAPMAWIAARLFGAKAITCVHGLDLVAPSRLYRWLWLPFIRRCDLVIANSRHTALLAESCGVSVARIEVLHPGVEVPSPLPQHWIPAAVESGSDPCQGKRAEIFPGDYPGRPVLLSVGRLTERKGLVPFVSVALPLLVERIPEVLFVVVGSEASDALHRTGSGSMQRVIETAASAAGVADHIRFMGACDDCTLANLFMRADVHVFPVLESPSDVEGFGMVAIEAAAHGLPTVAFRVGGVPDAVADGISGSLVAPGNYEGLVAAVVHWLGESRDTREACIAFATRFAWPRFHCRAVELIDRVVKG